MNEVCTNCSGVITRDCFYSPRDYENCLAYIAELIESGSFVLVYKTCGLGNIKDKNGCWADDIIVHTIQCKNCGRKFTCSVNTYRGQGSFMPG